MKISLDTFHDRIFNGTPMRKIDDEDPQSLSQAKISSDTDVYIFTLKGSRLRCGDGLLLVPLSKTFPLCQNGWYEPKRRMQHSL